MSISTTAAQTTLKNLNTEASSLTPTSVVQLFEIDLSSLALDRGLSLTEDEKVFRFHNNIKLIHTHIIWNGYNYIAAPIEADGFEINSRGTLPTPRLRLAVNDAGIPYLALLKQHTKSLGDLTGAKVTRYVTFAKFIDADNWGLTERPTYLTPDASAPYRKDVFYIDRKSTENKFILEYELASTLDIEGLKLPKRLVLADRCVWNYRGEGCLWEYNVRRNDDIHGDAILHVSAPPIANEKDELISDIIGQQPSHPRQYVVGRTYGKGASVYITKNGLNYYYVGSVDNITAAPPNLNFWIPDSCSKSLRGCKLRHTTGALPFGGFPGAEKIQ